MNAEIIGNCWNCGHGLKASDYGRETNCLKCGKPTRVCLNCCWYAPSRPNACEEPVAEPVMEKQRANFCNFFEVDAERKEGSAQTAEADHLAAAEDLFKF
jgi:hypothetical protein